MVQPLQKTIWIFLKKLKIDLPYGPAKEMEMEYRWNICTPIYCSIIQTSQNMETT